MTIRTAVARLEAAREAVAALPGVVAAGLTSGEPPLFGGTETGAVQIQGQPARPPDQMTVAQWHDIDPNYFTALGRHIVHGRDFAAGDADGAVPVAIVNESFVSRLLPDTNPIGQLVTVQNHAAEIVGVVADVRPSRPDRQAPSEIFWPIRQYPRFAAFLVVRLHPSAGALDRTIKTRVEDLDRTLRVGRFLTLDSRFADSLVSPRFNMLIVATFALMAIVLAAVGVYGTVAFSVGRRTREIGMRMALGATAGGLVFGIVRRVLALTGIGMAAGLLLALYLGRAVESVAYGISVRDPLVLATTLAGFAGVAAMAAWLPARRASRIDPLTALRSE
jgi:putative ABC transport system permease protein